MLEQEIQQESQLFRHIHAAPDHESQPIRVSRRDAPAGIGRWAAMLGGGALAAYGLSRRDIPNGWILAATGCGIAYLGTSRWKGRLGPGSGIRVAESTTILRPRGELYRFWRDFTNLPRVVSHVHAVEVLGNKSRWIVDTPLGRYQWDAELHTERQDELLSWRALPGSIIDTAGSVSFTDAPGDRGTEVKVVLRYDTPAGMASDWIARLWKGSPQQQVREDLHRFKQLMETGGIPAA